MAFGHERPDDPQRHALDQDDGAERIVRGRKELAVDGLADHHDECGTRLVFGADGAAGGNLPIGDRRVVGGDALDVGHPVLAGIFGLAHLPDQVGDLSDRGGLAPDCLGVADRQGRGAARAAAGAKRRHRSRLDDEQVGAETLDLLAHGLVGALTDGHHRDQRGDADEDPEHGQHRAHLVAHQRLHRRGQDHHSERPGKRRSARRC